MSNILRTGHTPSFSGVQLTPNSHHSAKSIIQDKINTLKQTDNGKYQNLQKLYIEIKTNGLVINHEYVSKKMESIMSLTTNEIKVFINMCQHDEVNIHFSGVCIHQQRIKGNFNNGNFAFAKLVDCNFSE